MALATAELDRWIETGRREYVCVSGVHGVMECQRDPALKAIHNRAGMVLPDGMPLAWWARRAGGPIADRVCGPEFFPHIVETLPHRAHFFYGATEATLDQLCQQVRLRSPGARIVGAYAPPFRPLTPQEDADVIRRINDSGADIVWVGLSTPKQERWMAEHRQALNAAALIGVGAAFDMEAGNVRRAPKFLRRTGLEWTYRLVLEPRRLWRRYLINNPGFLVLAAAQASHLINFPEER
jgi:N-acetylglucosaminyldiphosphoundecaprenol N-acetyl-beta-D-mannosaminyltransferase